MGMPFVFGKSLDGQSFIGREREVSKLASNITYQKNTLVLSSRGWGKTSLLDMAISKARSRDYQLRICRISLYDVPSPERFCSVFASAVIRATSANLSEAVAAVKKYLQGTSPLMDAETDSLADFSITFGTSEALSTMSQVLGLPELIAKDRNYKVVVCIDDFHNVASYPDPKSFIDNLDSRWSLHKMASYCLFADRNEVTEGMKTGFRIFATGGQVIDLGAISQDTFINYIRSSFADTGKYIDEEAASLVVSLVGGHPYYVQQLAQQSWLRTGVVCPKETVIEAHDTMADVMSLVFKTLTESLTQQQLCYMRALLCGERIISTAEVLHRYGISSATSASRSKSALLSRNIIELTDGNVMIKDPVYAYWLKTRYFKI